MRRAGNQGNRGLEIFEHAAGGLQRLQQSRAARRQLGRRQIGWCRFGLRVLPLELVNDGLRFHPRFEQRLQFGFPEVQFVSHARHRIMPIRNVTGDIISPRTAHARGLIDDLLPPEKLLQHAVDLARTRAAAPSYGRVKQQLKGDTLARMNEIIRARNDPMLQRWV